MTHPKTYLRYLPAEGEIKVGDYNLQTHHSTMASHKPVIGIWHDTEPPVNGEFMKFQKVERFAVTTEIAVGDEVMNGSGIKHVVKSIINGFVITDKGGMGTWRKDLFFKILAPISPAVTWEILDGAVIEGQYGKWLILHNWLYNNESDSKIKPDIFYIKGPCGHYH